MSDKTGRPKEEGGHKRIQITVNNFVDQALEKVGNKSKFLESVAKPVLEQLDPGDASKFVWEIDVYLRERIEKATKEMNLKQVSALAWVYSQLDDVRKLSGNPPENLERLTNLSASGDLKSKFLKALGEVISENVYGDPFKAWSLICNLYNVAPTNIKEKIRPYFIAARNSYDKELTFASKYFSVKTKIVPLLLDKFSSAIYET